MAFRSIKGTKDVLPADTHRWQHIESVVRSVFQRFNYKEIRTPLFEQTALFSRSIGELTDIVGKEMYTFEDRSGDRITLRPEGTASVIRAFIQNNLAEQLPLTKVYYIGPMFRQERPQAGRLRQFHQFGAEAIGSPCAEVDAEVIAMAIEVYRTLGLRQYSLKINSVGCEKCRPLYKVKLQEELRKIAPQLSADSQRRIDENPMRVLDSKDEQDQKLTADMPLINQFLCEECSLHFSDVQRMLESFGITYTVNGRLVRGLDYYTKTAFELTSTELGSQDALAGGGRYDLLAKELGGKQTPGVGFAAGIERLLMVLEKTGYPFADSDHPQVFIAAADDPARAWTIAETMRLRGAGIAAETDLLRRSLKAQMREADRQRALHVLVVGERELVEGKAALKSMQDGTSRMIPLDAIALALTDTST
ncbi:MAG: histidine--tRNA ligase [Ignavibacteriales bacterium]|nr:histidine--tRNA ligase [Ignavibacteriales bacterium]